ncbi:MAG: DUF6328 family protein [Phycisphaerae bacterium]|nr:DUF6328 family protein [Tepidisphaeraceae bacterium]
MSATPDPTPPNPDAQTDPQSDGDLGDMLQELRILLQGSQVLTGFLIVLPFAEGFGRIGPGEKWVFLATFVSALASLILFSSPAAHHRIERPLVDRVRFKLFATRMILAGLIALSVALVLATQLVVAEVAGLTASLVGAACTAVAVIVIWWVLPLARKATQDRRPPHPEP